MPSVERVNAEDEYPASGTRIFGGNATARSRLLEPLVYSGSLDSYKYQDLTPVIGREFEGLQVTDLLQASDAVIKDLAVTGQSLHVDCTEAVVDLSSQSPSEELFSCAIKMSLLIRCETSCCD